MGDINSSLNVSGTGYVISDSGKYSGFGYPDIRIPVEITNLNTCTTNTGRTHWHSFKIPLNELL